MSTKTFTLRLNDEQHEFLERRSKEEGISKNDYIRMLLEGEIQADKQDRIMKELLEIKSLLEKSTKK